ncbi:MAG: hypothetical protein INQ03_03930 [Candidatus Heimdallarchaeota archaeon]|nr:hypothetical protein [Candidatus Heimdallarchaeota archaeon]
MSSTEKKIFDFLKSIALEDGRMTVDETRIITTAMRTAISFDEYLIQALDDSVITEEEKERLNQLLDRIYVEAEKQAMRDDVVSDDEKELLSKLATFISSVKDKEGLS